MPGLSKRKTFAKPRNFQCPVKTKGNIASLLGEDFQKMQSSQPDTVLTNDKIGKAMTVIENQQLEKKSVSNNLTRSSSITLSFSQSTSEMDSETINDPKMKTAYFKFVEHLANLSSQLDETVSSTPKCSQDLKVVLPQSNFREKQVENGNQSLEAHENEDSCQLAKATKTTENVKRSKNVKADKPKKVVKNKPIRGDKLQKKKFDKENFVLKSKNKKLDKDLLQSTNDAKHVRNTEDVVQTILEKTSQKKRKPKPSKEVNSVKRSTPKLTRKKEIETVVSNEKSIKETPSFVYNKMKGIHESRNVGLYVMCDLCDKYRYLSQVTDPLDLPKKWYCYLNPDTNHSKCEDPEEEERDEDKGFCIQNCYNSGSVVWARIDGFPWWPAMVEDDPDFEVYYWLEESLVPVRPLITVF